MVVLQRVPHVELDLGTVVSSSCVRQVREGRVFEGLLVLPLTPTKDVVDLLEEGQQLPALGNEIALDDDPSRRAAQCHRRPSSTPLLLRERRVVGPRLKPESPQPERHRDGAANVEVHRQVHLKVSPPRHACGRSALRRNGYLPGLERCRSPRDDSTSRPQALMHVEQATRVFKSCQCCHMRYPPFREAQPCPLRDEGYPADMVLLRAVGRQWSG